MVGMARCRGSVDLFESKKSKNNWDPKLHRTLPGNHKGFKRHHMRTLLTPVGTPLKDFISTKDLVHALLSVVKHLELAYEAGVLHRDVSEGNVLLLKSFATKGFLLDWDYAEFTPRGLKAFHKAFPARQKKSDKYEEIGKSLKDVTGTPPFMAIEILKAAYARELDSQADAGEGGEEDDSEQDDSEMDDGESSDGTFVGERGADEELENVEDGAENSETKEIEEVHGEDKPAELQTELKHDLHHDLESVFWLLTWMILRHTDHGHANGALACVDLFGPNPNAKGGWLISAQFMKAGPLFQLAEDLRNQVLAQYVSRTLNIAGFPLANLTPAKFRAAFEQCLNAEWKPDDSQSAIPYQIPHKDSAKNNTVPKGSQSLFRVLVDNRLSLPSNIQSAKQGTKGKSAVAQGSKAEPAASTGSKRGRPADNESPPTEPKAARSRQFKKARRSEVAVDDAEEMQGGVDEEGEMDVEGDEGEEMDVEAPPPVTTHVLRSATKHDSGEEKAIVKSRKKKVADVRAGGSSGKKNSTSRRR
ncbi:hypothetical protein R3P38DRAFT_1849280 [Favolaschia claudopus]|uniref:Protein kinase domain-containing protein n=1 Tax=Favolaschia claudopus TaxID=2862362 RepID=A0AAW0DA95_9AGAR